MALRNITPADIETYRNNPAIRPMPPVRIPARLQGFREGWSAAALAGGRMYTRDDLVAYELLIQDHFTYQQRTMVNGFKDGWVAALEASSNS